MCKQGCKLGDRLPGFVGPAGQGLRHPGGVTASLPRLRVGRLSDRYMPLWGDGSVLVIFLVLPFYVFLSLCWAVLSEWLHTLSLGDGYVLV